MSRARDLANLLDATGDVVADALDNAPPSQGRNLIINGAMQMAQRGTSSSSTGYQTVDRWRLNLGTQQEQKTDTPDQFKNSMEITGTVAGSSGYGIVLQRIESNNIYGALGQDCTLSCYVKNTGTSTANVSVEVYRANSTDNFSAITLVSSLTSQAITSGWTRITFPAFAVPTTASTGLEVRIFRYDASNDQEWLITGVQLEVGTVATPFEHRSYGEELALCQRYYYNSHLDGDFSAYQGQQITIAVGGGSFGAAAGAMNGREYPTTMRATPAVVLYHQDGTADACYRIDNGAKITGVSALYITLKGFLFAYKASGFLTSYGYYYGYTADAEL